MVYIVTSHGEFVKKKMMGHRESPDGKKILNCIADEQDEIFNYHFKDILTKGSKQLKLMGN
jgi:hypothetical protein